MMIYLRKVFMHDTTHEISITKNIVSNFFNNMNVFKIIGKKSSKQAEVTINNATDYRLGNEIKKLIIEEGDIEIDDLLLFTNKNNKFTMEIIKKQDDRYYTFYELFTNATDRHIVFMTDDYNESSQDDTEHNTKSLEDDGQVITNIQRIYYGSPGTGKSFKVNQLIKQYYITEHDSDRYIFRTTIYSDFSYYNFIGSILPEAKDNEIKYTFKAGVFTQALTAAFKYPSKNIFLVIEEMTRGDIAAIFGDIFQLLDRNSNGNSEYCINNDLIYEYLKKEKVDKELNNGNQIYLPKNLHILGTINTTDQNVNVMDTAFKRRFDFEYISTAPIDDKINNYAFMLNDGDKNNTYEWIKLYTTLNKFIVSKLNLSEDKQIGQFFLKFCSNDKENYLMIKNKLLYYLWEDIQNISYTSKYSIFSDKYKMFSELYKAFENNEEVFSEQFITLYNEAE